jgi:hypothetical protein
LEDTVATSRFTDLGRARRAQEARAIPRSRPKRLAEARRRLAEELEVECRATADYGQSGKRVDGQKNRLCARSAATRSRAQPSSP